MSGNFDTPPAFSNVESNSSDTPPQFPFTTPDGLNLSVPTSLQHLRELLHSESRVRERTNQVGGRLRDSTSQTHPPSMSSESYNPSDHRRRRAIIREVTHQVHNQSPGQRGLSQPSNVPGVSVRARPRASPSERYLQRHRQQQEAQQSTALTGLRQAGADLSQAGSNLSNLSALLEEPPRLNAPSITAQEYSGEAEVNRRRFKRRKLEGDALTPGYQGFTYGHFGQVVPGRLKMEIVSCDGGNYSEIHPGEKDYLAENVLRNDKSVYCTKSNRCNLVLRHQGETTFDLKKLVIKAPQRGFTAPVQEGMVFISMTLDDLLARTTQYRIHYTTPSAHQMSASVMQPDQHQSRSAPSRTLAHQDSSRPSSENTLSTSLASTRDLQNAPNRERYSSLASHLWSGPTSASFERSLLESVSAESQALHNDNISEDCEYYPVNLDFASQNTSAPTPPPFTVTTECSDDSGDEEVASSPATIADRSRRDYLWFAQSDVEEDDDDAVALDGPSLMGPPGSRRARRRVMPSRIEAPAQTPTQVQSPRQNMGEDVKQDNSMRDQEIMAPHARFFIQREKSMISIRFDPPVSGRYILLKLWSPAQDENIDIQCISAHGFAGPRFFPAVSMI